MERPEEGEYSKKTLPDRHCGDFAAPAETAKAELEDDLWTACLLFR